MAISKEDFAKLIKSAVANGVSDIHIRTNERPCFRLRGDLVPVKINPYTYDDVIDVARIVIKDEETRNQVEELKELDGSFAIPKLCRLRYNYLRYQGKAGLILRIIDATIPSSEDLKLPPVINKIALAHKGLVLVTGATGSGKSSTLAAMINHINDVVCTFTLHYLIRNM